MSVNEKLSVIKKPDLTQALEQSCLELVAEQSLQVKAITADEANKALFEKLAGKGKTFSPSDYYHKLADTETGEGEIDFIAISPKKDGVRTTQKLLDFAQANNLRPATKSEMSQYILNNLGLNGKTYMASLEISQVSAYSLVPSAYFDDPEFQLNADTSRNKWSNNEALLFVRE